MEIKKNVWLVILVLVIIVAAVSVILLYSNNQPPLKNTNSNEIAFDGGDWRYVFERQTLTSVDPESGYGDEAKVEFYVSSVADSNAEKFYSAELNPDSYSASFDGTQLEITEPMANGDVNENTVSTISLRGEVISENVPVSSSNYVINSDETLRAYALFQDNPEAKDGEPIKIFSQLIVERISDKTNIATYYADTADNNREYLTPLAFSQDNEGIFYIDWPSAPQEDGAPYELVYHPFDGQPQVLFENPSSNGEFPYVTYSIINVLPEQGQILAWVKDYPNTMSVSDEYVATFDVSSKTWLRFDLPCASWNMYVEPSTTNAHCFTSDNKIVKFSIVTGEIQSVLKPYSSAISTTPLMFSPDYTLLVYAIDTTKQRSDQGNGSNSINGINGQINVATTYLFDLINGVSKKLFDSEYAVINQQIGDTVNRFLGFIN